MWASTAVAVLVIQYHTLYLQFFNLIELCYMLKVYLLFIYLFLTQKEISLFFTKDTTPLILFCFYTKCSCQYLKT